MVVEGGKELVPPACRLGGRIPGIGPGGRGLPVPKEGAVLLDIASPLYFVSADYTCKQQHYGMVVVYSTISAIQWLFASASVPLSKQTFFLFLY